ncbi:MAG: protein-export chaperone SecB [Rhodospirillales bacterium]|nr:protein-export chaperone SecB [Rhodospirillales bacterium]
MTEENTPQDDQPVFVINGQYIKDLSFEVPNAPQIFGELNKGAPDIPINVDIQVNKFPNNVFEVVLHLQIDSKLGDARCFLVELAYAGVFTVNVAQEHLQPMLFIECPRMLFPFARAIIADMTREGGFPPLMMQPIDFSVMYRQRMEHIARQQPAGNA